MSGDNFHGEQPTKFYSEEMTEAKRILINTSYVYEIESLLINARYKTGSPLQD